MDIVISLAFLCIVGAIIVKKNRRLIGEKLKEWAINMQAKQLEKDFPAIFGEGKKQVNENTMNTAQKIIVTIWIIILFFSASEFFGELYRLFEGFGGTDVWGAFINMILWIFVISVPTYILYKVWGKK